MDPYPSVLKFTHPKNFTLKTSHTSLDTVQFYKSEPDFGLMDEMRGLVTKGWEPNRTLFNCLRATGLCGSAPQRDYTVRGQSNVWHLSNYWPPTPSPPGECVGRGEDTLAGWRGGGRSIVRKTTDTALYSIYVSTLWSTPTVILAFQVLLVLGTDNRGMLFEYISKHI